MEMEIWYLIENHLDWKEVLVAEKVTFSEIKVLKPQEIKGLAFPKSEKEKVFEILGISSSRFEEYETEQENLLLLVKRDDFEVILENRSDMHAWDLIKPVLTEFAEILETNIYVSNPHGSAVEPRNEDGKLFIRFWSIPRVTRAARIRKPFGISISEGQSDARLATGDGIPVIDDERQVVAEICGGTLYVLFDLPHSEDNAAPLMTSIMTRYTLLKKSPEEFNRMLAEIAENELKRSRKAYVKECGRRLRNTIRTLKSDLRDQEKNITDSQKLIVESVRREQEIRKALDLFLSDSSKEDALYASEFDKLVAVPGVVKVVVNKEGLISIFTDQIDVRYSGATYDIGKFRIDIITDGSEGAVRCYNLTRNTGGYAHPHIRSDGKCCLGNISDGVAKLIGSHEYSVLAQLMLRFLGVVNEDGWYLSVRNWPKKEEK